jgi:glutamate-1-semialdehyde 2,1-aminomutase
MSKRKLNKSKKLLAKAEILIPRAAQTLSKAPDQFVSGVSPYALARGRGAYVWDVDGNEYLDLTCSLGGVVLGYGQKEIERAVLRQRKKGTIFGLPGNLEVELAIELKKLMPFCEMLRFGLNGSDVTAAAIRVSRAYTGRDHIAKCGYHGWHDWTIATNKMRSRGVPVAVKKLTHEFFYNNLASLEKIFRDYPNQIAAVIMEPVDAEMPRNNFLLEVKKMAKRHGAVFIFDELINGFRLAKGGAAEYFRV